MIGSSCNSISPGSEAERVYLVSLIREDYERSHPGETLDDMKRRSAFSKKDKGLLRDWMALAVMRAAGQATTPFEPRRVNSGHVKAAKLLDLFNADMVSQAANNPIASALFHIEPHWTLGYVKLPEGSCCAASDISPGSMCFALMI